MSGARGVVRAFAPASTGNVIAGFDTLGAALAPADGERWGDVVTVTESDRDTLECSGLDADALPSSADNLVWRALDAWCARTRRERPPLAIALVKGLPVGSGVGSSSASIAAVLRAAHALLGDGEDDRVLLEAAGDAESGAAGARHLDNVAPALLGGLRFVGPDGRAELLPWFDELRFVVASPALRLETRRARAVLPAAVALGDAVEHARALGAFVHALHTGNREWLRAALRDRIAEPHRLALVPGAADLRDAALAAGAWGCSFSGAGPAMLAIAAAPDVAAVSAAMARAWESHGVACVTRECLLDRFGARVLGEGA
ncbi:MAG: homoserine kinase [Candidatus Eisenbacteria bacterium]|nr:homoserine kinase [Candidatus Eisenbacteria bacterium]